MGFRSNHNSGNKAVTLLATCLVVLGGAITCAAIGLSAESGLQKKSSLQWTGATTGGIIVLLWLLRDRPRENQARAIWAWLGRKRRRTVVYRAQPKLPAGQRSTAPPAPPTAESVRSITAGTNKWVPVSTAPPKRPSSGTNS
ncbi:MAG TPA: hypothetical protein VGM05_28125 [Planctomycetaceae bacterium]|jgi:hypothetical protein